MKIHALLVCCLAIIFTTVSADLPVHCLHENIRGEWLIYRSSLKNVSQPQKCLSGMESVDYIKVVRFTSPNIVRSDEKDIGTWTMVYDQGFEFTMDSQIFFAFNKYEQNETTKVTTSHCGETSFGWFRERASNQHGCFFARKVNPKARDTLVSLPINSLLYLSKEEEKKLTTHQNDIALVDSINANEKWQAMAYDFLEQMTDDEIWARSGVQVSTEDVQKLHAQSKLLALADDEELSELRRSMLPKNFDWRNVNGENYVGDVRDQQACGSCYAFAATAAIESRIRIKTKNQVRAVISPQQIVSCSDYNQGCHGGFPFMVGKHGFDYPLIPDDCFQYTGNKNNCSAACTNPQYKVRVTKYEYIGGYYGANTEIAMMEEIYKHGPIPVNYLVYPDFHYYKQGIYKHHNKQKTNFNIKTSRKGVKHWEATTHAVVVVGWGEQDGERYWIAKNSWGTRWGMNGYFNIRRGLDECAIEMQASAIHPEIISN